MKIKALPKSFEMSHSSVPYYYNDKYLSNGCFLMPRCWVKDDYKYLSGNPQAKRDDLDRVIPIEDKARFTYIKTNRLFDYGDFLVREFECSNHFSQEEKKAYIREDYVKFFEIEELKGEHTLSAFICPTNSVVIMPCRNPNTKTEG
jgi:hypothetical protein